MRFHAVNDPKAPSPMLSAVATSFCKRNLRRGAQLAVLTALAGAAIPSLASAQAPSEVPASAKLPCRSVALSDAHGGPIALNSHLALIRNGKVQALNANTGAARMIRFTGSSGRWSKSITGDRYALAGQAITPDGRRGGNYVIAAKLLGDRSILCAGGTRGQATTKDTASVAADGSLIGIGMLEVAASTRNASVLLENYSTQKVCTNTSTHPDGARLVSRPTATIWCYGGRGAWLNDPNGQERDQFGAPILGPLAPYSRYPYAYRYQHYVQYNGAVVPAAKRPAAKPWGEAMPNSLIAWRPVAPKFYNPPGL